jgi:formate hydrogenlyase transcriptional activator
MASDPRERKQDSPARKPIPWPSNRWPLEENADWNRDLVEHSRDLLCVHDLQGRLLSVNPGPARLLGYSIEEILQIPLRDLIDPTSRDQFDAYLREIERVGEAHGVVAVMTRTGERRLWEYHNTLRTDRVETPVVRGMAHDVTERVQAEKALRHANEKLMQNARAQESTVRELTLFRSLLDQSNDAILVTDPETLRFLDSNERAWAELGYSREELLSMTVFDIDPDIVTVRSRLDQQLRQTGCAFIERAHRRKDGTTFPVELNLRRVRLDREYDVAVSRDITARKRTEEALRETHEQLLKTAREQEATVRELKLFRALLDQSNDGIEVVEPETLRFLDVNERACAELGYSRKELLSMTVFDIDPNISEDWRGWMRQQMQESEFAIMERVHRRKDGTTFPVEVNSRRVRLDRDYRVGIVRNITERKRAEEALRESEARERARAKELATVLDVVPVPVFIAYDAECVRMTGNLAAHEQRRVPAGKNLSKSAPPEERPTYRLMEDGVEIPTDLLPMQQAAATGKPVYGRALTMVLEDGSERETVVNAVPLLDDEGKTRAVVGSSIDLTELKQAERALRASETRFRTVYERSPVGIALVDSHSQRFLQVNPTFCEITGRSEEELLGLDVGSITHPDDVERSHEYLQKLAEEKLANYELEKRYVRPDGSVRWVKILVVPMWSEGETRRWQLGLVQDITERRRAEAALRQNEAELREAQRLGRIGSWYRDLKTDRMTWSEQLYRLLGVDPERGALSFNDTEKFFSPESRQRLLEANERLLHTAIPDELEVQFRRDDGTVGWATMYREVDRDDAGSVVGIRGTAIEITERRQVEEALRQSEERFRVALNHSPTTVFSLDRDLRFTWIYNSKLPLPLNEKLGKTPCELFGPTEAAKMMEVGRRVLETGLGFRHEMQVAIGGTKRYLDTMIEPTMDSTGAVIGLTGASTDVTALREVTESLREAKERLTEEKLYLEHEIDTELGFQDIVGQSKPLKELMESVGKVATSDATVLLLGETGTGKELVARAIHRLSQRSGNAFIKMNCAAIPSGLLESELFGNEKGAFTGAVSKKIGRLELADKGTLFLDEIGEISLELQPKLLRVLQDQEFERLGGTQTLKVDFRLIAATNRDLAESVRENEFRSDLYYRLNVFPIHLPPLRNRRDDIPLLVEHFVQKCARRMNKSITSIPKKTMNALTGWDWPGNIRELENFVERSVILTNGSVLSAPLRQLQPAAGEKSKSEDETLKAKEREHILRALRESRGQVSGVRGAAARLGLKRTTLQSKLKHLGINPRVPPLG